MGGPDGRLLLHLAAEKNGGRVAFRFFEILQNLSHFLLGADKRLKNALQIFFDALIILIALTAAVFLRIETLFFLAQPEFITCFAFVLFPTIFLFARMGLYRAFMRYVSTEIAVLVALGSGFSALALLVTSLMLVSFIPWTVTVIYAALLFILVCGSRFIIRALFRMGGSRKRKKLAVYGAGEAGVQILQSLRTSPDYRVRMVIDDNPKIRGQEIFGLRIMSFAEAAKKFEDFEIDTVLLAMPSMGSAARRKIFARVNEYALEVKTIPPVASLINGTAKITEFKDVAIEDLLGRERVAPLPDLMGKNIAGKTVLVTGAGGSIGSELCRQIIQLKPQKLLLLDVSELAIYTISEEIEHHASKFGVELVSLVGSVQDRPFIAAAMRNHKIDTIYHAAAYKHVPLMEQNILQAVKNNTLGTMVLAEEAVRAGVASFTLVSTDKAVNPTNIMGASKRLAERVCQMMGIEQTKTRFSVVRFGNVLGSSGSVVPLFKKQIAAGGPLTLTHPDVTRYFMTIGEAVQLVIQASSLAKGSEVFVLDMGRPVKIRDLAFKMVQLSGLKPYLEGEGDAAENEGDIAVQITGLRPGEKMYEELTYGDNLVGTAHPRIMTVNEAAMTAKEMRIVAERLGALVAAEDQLGLTHTMTEIADYTPDETVTASTAEAQSQILASKIVPLAVPGKRG